MSPRHFLHFLARDEGFADAEGTVATDFEQFLPVLIHPANDMVAEAGGTRLPVGSNAGVDVA